MTASHHSDAGAAVSQEKTLVPAQQSILNVRWLERGRPLPWWIGPLVIGSVLVGMLAWTWATWPDVLVDFGVQLYIPWRLTKGEVLYRDVAHYNGPLSPYWNALWFRILGVHLWTLIAVNLGLLAALILLLYRVFRDIASHAAACAACLVFVLLFACAEFVGTGNYNYVCPYAHEMVHGVILGLTALLAIWRFPMYGRRWLAIGGFALGLTFLTKADVFQAAALATVSAMALVLWNVRPGLRQGSFLLLLVLGSALAPPLLAFAGFCLAMPVSQAFRAAAGAWTGVFNPQVFTLRFYQEGMGLLHLADSLRQLLLWCGYYLAIVVPAAIVALLQRRRGNHALAWTGLTVLVSIGTFGVLWPRCDWPHLAIPLPVAMALIATIFLIQFLRHPRMDAYANRRIKQISLTLFAFALLGKMILNVRIYHYGFVLAMPATLVLVVAVLDWVPAAIERHGGTGLLFQSALAVFVAGFVALHLTLQAPRIAGKTEWIGEGGDAFRADGRGLFVNAAIRAIKRFAQPGQTLAAFPEGAMLNYLCRRRNPTPYTNFMPVEVSIFGSERVFTSFEEHPPDLVALVHKDTSEFGYRFFGQDYAQPFQPWLERHYQRVALVGDPPLRSRAFGIALYQRRPPPQRANP